MWRVIVALSLMGMVTFTAPLYAGEVTENQCNVVPGDADSSGALNLADFMYLINYIYDKDKPPCFGVQTGNCWAPDPICRMDLNGSGTASLGDAIILFHYIFDNDNPFTFCKGSDPGNCWTLVSSGTCCLPTSPSTSYPTGQDPGMPDRVRLSTDMPTIIPSGGGDIILKVWLETDNVGTGNDVNGFSIPIKLRSSNSVAEVYLVDSTVFSIYKGTAVENWLNGSLMSANINSDLVSLGGFGNLGIWSGLTSGTHLIANLKVHASDSTTLSFGFWPYPDNPYLALVTSLGEEYSPCAYKAGDLDRDGRVSVVDVVYLVNIVLKSWANPGLPCLVDVNGSGSISLSDVIYLARYVFKSAPPPVSGGGCCP